MEKTWNFSEIDFLYSLYKPFSPLGRAEKDKKYIFTSRAELEVEYSLTEHFVRFIAANPLAAAKIENRLAGIPPIAAGLPARITAADIFIIKKFLFNARAAIQFLPGGIKKSFGAKWRSEPLLALLKKGGGDEAFYLSEAYSSELAGVRAKIRAIDAKIAALKSAALRRLAKRFGVNFGEREFLVFERKSCAKLYDSGLFFIEPYDNNHAVVKPVYGGAYLELVSRREELLRLEKSAEARVIAMLAAKIRAESKNISSYIVLVTKVDTLLAKARLARGLQLVRPVLAGGLRLDKARLLPLESRLKSEGLAYTPLSCVLPKRLAVISGSNMGGKTVALKTICFMQLAAQLGFFVPARRYRTKVFEMINYVGDSAGGETFGLSSFGAELAGFMDAYRQSASRRTLFIIDEFAKTTNSTEAAALISGMLAVFSARPGINALLATHFDGVKPAPAADFFRMKGFSGAAFRAHLKSKHRRSRESGLKSLNRFMRYELVKTNSVSGISDALEVAEILGLDAAVLRAARNAIKEQP